MEKLSIEEKAKAYDEALGRVENIKTGKCEATFIFTEGLFEHIFPELRDSEDERIKKAIILFFETQDDNTTYSFIPKKDILAWLEKQKDHEDELEKAYKTADEVQYRRGYEDAKKEIVKQDEQKSIISDDALREGIAHFGITQYQIDNWLKKYVEVEKLEQKPAKNLIERWKDMRLEVYAQASGNRHEPNCSDDKTKMFSLSDIDEIIEKISNQKPADKVEQEYHCNGVREPKESTSVLKQLLVEQKSNCSEEALQYLRENHSSSEISDFQAAMNIAVANAYDKGKADAINTMKTEWGRRDSKKME